MKKYTFILFIFLVNSILAQTKCATDVLHQAYLRQHPGFASQIQQMESVANAHQVWDKSGIRIIPVVFHIIHEGGIENISDNQILDGLKIMNEDFRNINPRIGTRPAAFDSLAGDMAIEFRLTTKDPNGNCTNGIIRKHRADATTVVFDSINLTEINFKSDAWDNSKYLNIWVVKNIVLENGASGVIGFARYPYYAGPGNPIDGVVIKHDYVGSIETAVQPAGLGATLSHEIGHWCGLIHTWGGEAFLSCGDDLVYDTPQQYQQNWGCPVYPSLSNCGNTNNAPHGDMFMNFMDYVDGNCMNMFTEGQKTRTWGFLNTIRTNIWTPSNLIATGVSDSSTIALNCMPIASFYSNTQEICAGKFIDYAQNVYNGTFSNLKWYFEGGTPSTSTAQKPVIQYNTPGVYQVKLVVFKGSDSIVTLQNNYASILSNTAQNQANTYIENFDAINNWTIVNNDVNTPTWEQANINNNNVMLLKNFNDTLEQHYDEFISGTYDLTQVANPKIYFKVAHALKGASVLDRLSLKVSRDCGVTWLNRYAKTGNALTTAGTKSTYFIPDVTEWRQESTSLLGSLITDNVRFKFEFRSGKGNNIYIDDFAIMNQYTVGITEEIIPQINIYPNPSNGIVTIENVLINHEILITNILGQVISKKITTNSPLLQLDLSSYNKGVYLINIKGGKQNIVKTVVLN